MFKCQHCGKVNLSRFDQLKGKALEVVNGADQPLTCREVADYGIEVNDKLYSTDEIYMALQHLYEEELIQKIRNGPRNIKYYRLEKKNNEV